MTAPGTLRVLIVNDLAPAPGSGAEIHIARLADALSSEGHEVRFFAGERTHRGAAKVFDLWDPGARTALRLEAAGFRPHVVHFHNVTRELSGSVFGAVRGAARVLTVHDPRILGRPDGPTGAPLDAQPLRAIKNAKAGME
ncbi:MAG: glycosyltransferase, partial [Actinomycetota bacterium]